MRAHVCQPERGRFAAATGNPTLCCKGQEGVHCPVGGREADKAAALRAMGVSICVAICQKWTDSIKQATRVRYQRR